MDARAVRRRFGYLLRRFRRPIAGVLAFVTVLGVLTILRPAPAETQDLLVAARDLPAGTTLEPADLAPRAFALDSVPPAAIAQAAQAHGRTLSAPMLAGEALTQTRLVDAALSHEGAAYAVPIRLAEADVAALLSPGMLVDVVRAARGSPQIVADGVRVITVPRRPTANSFAGSAGSAASSLILVAADRTTAIRLAAAGTDGNLAVILR